MKLLEKKLNEITPYEKNARHNDDAVKYVANSIREYGFKSPIIIDKDGVIIAGHTRYKAAQELGLETVPCILADDLTPTQVKAYRLADNKVGEIATWDLKLLNEELDELVGELDMPMWDFGFELDERASDFKEEDIWGEETDTSDKDSNTIRRYAVVVDCEDEYAQQALYEQLEKEGYSCKMTTV